MKKAGEIGFNAKAPDLLTECGKVFYAVAQQLHGATKGDGLDVAMALGLTATRILFEMSKGDQTLALRANEIFLQTARQSMADMISGSDAHQVMQ